MKKRITTVHGTNTYIDIGSFLEPGPWEEKFAWLPVKTVSGKRCWLRKIYKCKLYIGNTMPSYFREVITNPIGAPVGVVYGDMFDILKDREQWIVN